MKRKSGKYSGRCKDCDMMQAGGSTPVEMRMQGKQDPFNWTSINTQCPQGYYFSVPDNQCRRIVSNTPAPQAVPTSNTSGYEWTNFPPLPKTAPTTASEASLWHNTPEDIDPQTGETFNERLPAGHPDNPKTGEYKGDYGSVQTTTTKVPHNWNTDVFLGLRGAQVAASYLAGKRRDSLMNEYDYKQQSALGQMNPMPISQFQYGPNDYTTPNRLYAQQGGMINPYSFHAKYGGNLKTIIREYGNWTNDAGPMDMGDGPIDDNGKMKKGGIALDEMIINDFFRNLIQYGRGPHPYKEYGRRGYQKGGRAPIIVNNPNDPRLKAYSDSLTLHKASNKSLADFNKEDYSSEFLMDDSRSVFDAYKRLKAPQPIETKTKYLPFSKTDNKSLPISVNLYKKPVQPVVYQKPEKKDYPIHTLSKAQVRGTISGGEQGIIPQPKGDYIYGPANSVIGVNQNGVFKPIDMPEQRGKVNKPDLDLMSDKAALSTFLRGKGIQYEKGGRFMGINPEHKGWCTPLSNPHCTGARRRLALTLKKHHGFHEKGGYYDDSRDAWIEADGTIGPNGPYRRKKGGLTPNKAREILHDGTAHGKKLTDKQRRYFGAMSKGHTNYTGK